MFLEYDPSLNMCSVCSAVNLMRPESVRVFIEGSLALDLPARLCRLDGGFALAEYGFRPICVRHSSYHT
ncbi:hypothetical protein DPMN_119767 [Dreissena polymorpha]|uniref:Uncharacterized protein n=1 Tax=Dreissena polymorpha TaxID=45954 RepID=A0A9D4GMK7_DREPO|nr:hypothetical protein DPMN_119767 [Dreissena polymorpha]